MPPKRLSNRLPLCLTLLLSARTFRLLWGSWLGSWANGATRGGFGCWPSGGLGWALVRRGRRACLWNGSGLVISGTARHA
ncbi:hypothetical protein BJV77DRAFT_1008254 [Russula vinacea]|nr:hypothetical protein BJV77DRAFT_1008254 [Russula vinacea]